MCFLASRNTQMSHVNSVILFCLYMFPKHFLSSLEMLFCVFSIFCENLQDQLALSSELLFSYLVNCYTEINEVSAEKTYELDTYVWVQFYEDLATVTL